MGRNDLIRAVSNRTGFAERTVREVLDAVVEQMIEVLATGSRVSLSPFGSFHLAKLLGSRRTNPKTGGLMEIPDRLYPRFTPSTELRKRVVRA